MNTNPLDVVLNDNEKAVLSQIASNETVLNALKKVFLFGIYYNGTLTPGENPNATRNFALSLTGVTQYGDNNTLSNEQIGAMLRAKTEGLFAVEGGFKELEKFKPVGDAPKPKVNKAR